MTLTTTRSSGSSRRPGCWKTRRTSRTTAPLTGTENDVHLVRAGSRRRDVRAAVARSNSFLQRLEVDQAKSAQRCHHGATHEISAGEQRVKLRVGRATRALLRFVRPGCHRPRHHLAAAGQAAARGGGVRAFDEGVGARVGESPCP